MAKRGSNWTENEDDLLIKFYNGTNARELQKVLPYRTLASIQQRVVVLRDKEILKRKEVKRWTEEETEFIVDNYLNMTPSEIAKKLGCTLKQIYSKANNLRLEGRIGLINKPLAPDAEKLKEMEEKCRKMNERDNELYKKGIVSDEKNRDYGIGKKQISIKFEKDKEYLLKIQEDRNVTRSFQGKLVQATHNHVTFINKNNIRESFLKSDFLLNKIKIKEMI